MSCPRRFALLLVGVLFCSSAALAWDCPAMEFTTKLLPSSTSENKFDMMLTPLNVRHSDIQRSLDEVSLNVGDKKISLLGMGDMSAANGTQSFKTVESFSWLPDQSLSYSFTYRLGDLICTSNLETLKAKVEHEAPKEVIVKITPPKMEAAPAPVPTGPTPAAGLCPVITYDHGVTPCEDLYAISFVNTAVDKPLHWIDIHYSINESPMSNHRMLQHSGPISTHSAEDEALGSAIVAKRAQEKLMKERAAALAASGATEMEVNAFYMQMQAGQMQMGSDDWGMQQGAGASGLQQQMGGSGFGMQQQASHAGQQQQLGGGSGAAGSVGGGMQQQQGGSSSTDASAAKSFGQQQQMSAGGSGVTGAAGSAGGMQQQQGSSNVAAAADAKVGFGQQQQMSGATGVGGMQQQQGHSGTGVEGAAGFGQQQQMGSSATGVGGMQQQQGHGVGGAAGFGQQQQMGSGVGGMQQQQGHGAGLGQQQQMIPTTVVPTVVPVTPIAPAIDVPKLDQPKVGLVPAVTKTHAPPLPTHEVELTPSVKVSLAPSAPAAPAAPSEFGHPGLSPINPACIIPTSCTNCQIFTHKGLLLTPGDKVTYWFTYCQDGVDCDTEKHEFIVPGAPAKQFGAPRGRECIAWRDL